MRFEEFADGTHEPGKSVADNMICVVVSEGSRRDARSINRVHTVGVCAVPAEPVGSSEVGARRALDLAVFKAIVKAGFVTMDGRQRRTYCDPSEIAIAAQMTTAAIIGPLRRLHLDKLIHFYGTFPECFSVQLTRVGRKAAILDTDSHNVPRTHLRTQRKGQQYAH